MNLSTEFQLLRETVTNFTKNELPSDNLNNNSSLQNKILLIKKLFNMRIFHLTLSDDLGGMESLSALSICAETLSENDASLATSMIANAAAQALFLYTNEEELYCESTAHKKNTTSAF